MISEELRSFAEDPAAWGTIEPESGLTRILKERYCLLLGPVPSFTEVSRLRLDPDELTETIQEVRDEIARHGHRRAMWRVASSAAPADLVDRLVAHGFVADDHATALVLEHEPAAAPDGVSARRVADFDEFVAATHVAARAFEMEEERKQEWDAIAEQRFALERAGYPRMYLAFVDGHPVGTASMWLEEGLPAALFVGGSVLPEARGRGAYRALVRARWDDAVAAGFDALTVHAGAMSRPVLERLGFARASEIEVLVDPATC